MKMKTEHKMICCRWNFEGPKLLSKCLLQNSIPSLWLMMLIYIRVSTINSFFFLVGREIWTPYIFIEYTKKWQLNYMQHNCYFVVCLFLRDQDFKRLLQPQSKILFCRLAWLIELEILTRAHYEHKHQAVSSQIHKFALPIWNFK